MVGAAFVVRRNDGTRRWFRPRRPVHSVALIYAGFLCERCGAYDPAVTSRQGGGELVPYRLLAEAVRRGGWKVECRDAIHYDYSVLCPACAECGER